MSLPTTPTPDVDHPSFGILGVGHKTFTPSYDALMLFESRAHVQHVSKLADKFLHSDLFWTMA